jgi:hypothetical protein
MSLNRILVLLGIAALLLFCGCDHRAVVWPQGTLFQDGSSSLDAQVLDASTAQDSSSKVLPDSKIHPDRPGSDFCDKWCPPAEGGTICLSGRVFDAVSLISKGAGFASVVGPKAGAMVKVYDPIAYISDPFGAGPMAVASIYNDDGCFIVESVDIPIAGLFALAVDDGDATKDKWALAALGLAPLRGVNSVDLEVLALPQATVSAWESETASLIHDGALLLWYRNNAQKGVQGVTPTLDGMEPSDSGQLFEGSALFYFDRDISQSPYFSQAAKTEQKTTSSGLVAVRKAPVKNYGGNKAGCQIEPLLGGSTPGALFIRAFDVTGCPAAKP